MFCEQTGFYLKEIQIPSRVGWIPKDVPAEGLGGGWRKFVGPGPLVCGVLLIATGCANNYISERLLTQLEKQCNTEPVGLREDLKGLWNSSRALGSA